MEIKDVLPFYNKLTEKEKEAVTKSTTKKKMPKKAVITAGENACSGLIMLTSGQLRAYITSSSGRQITIYRLLDGDICVLTASCALKNITFTIELECETDCEFYLLDSAAFDKINSENTQVKDYTMSLLSGRLSDAMFVINQTIFSSLDKRLANHLMEMYALMQSKTLIITHDEIANNLGSAREVITRMLKYFQSEGLIATSRGSIELLDLKRIEKLAI